MIIANDDLLGTVASGEAMLVTFRLASALFRIPARFCSVFYLLPNFEAASRLSFIFRFGFFLTADRRAGDSLIVFLGEFSWVYISVLKESLSIRYSLSYRSFSL